MTKPVEHRHVWNDGPIYTIQTQGRGPQRVMVQSCECKETREVAW